MIGAFSTGPGCPQIRAVAGCGRWRRVRMLCGRERSLRPGRRVSPYAAWHADTCRPGRPAPAGILGAHDQLADRAHRPGPRDPGRLPGGSHGPGPARPDPRRAAGAAAGRRVRVPHRCRAARVRRATHRRAPRGGAGRHPGTAAPRRRGPRVGAPVRGDRISARYPLHPGRAHRYRPGPAGTAPGRSAATTCSSRSPDTIGSAASGRRGNSC